MDPAPTNPVASDSLPPRFGGLLQHGRYWRLTRRGWGAVLLLVLLVSAVFLRGIHPFLALNNPVPADVLVVEGWAADYAIRQAVEEFHRGDYSAMYVTGGPLTRGAPLSEFGTYAALGAAVAESFGAPTNRVRAVPAPKVRRDRTFAAALALRDWLEVRGNTPSGLNLVSVGPHARRSRLLFCKAFGDRCEVGVIAVEDEDYDPRRWMAYSKGVRTVLSETAAYLYARLFFELSSDRETVGDNESGEDPVESSP